MSISSHYNSLEKINFVFLSSPPSPFTAGEIKILLTSFIGGVKNPNLYNTLKQYYNIKLASHCKILFT